MNWKIGELFYELQKDSKRRILFVEGKRNISLWKRLIPPEDRLDTVVYPISVVACDPVAGGERGRLLWCAGHFLKKCVS
jgi:hypothetical protein